MARPVAHGYDSSEQVLDRGEHVRQQDPPPKRLYRIGGANGVHGKAAGHVGVPFVDNGSVRDRSSASCPGKIDGLGRLSTLRET